MVNEAGSSLISHVGITLDADAFMDTVSMIRGNIGRPALKEEDKIYFMRKKITLAEMGKISGQQAIPFEFVLEATVPGQHLLDAYIGVEFSIVVNYILIIFIWNFYSIK